MKTLLEKRDAILDSLRAQFRCRVLEIVIVNPLEGDIPRTYAITRAPMGTVEPTGQIEIPTGLDALLRDISNNIAQGMADEDDEDDDDNNEAGIDAKFKGVTSW
jgi:hypothetical protein